MADAAANGAPNAPQCRLASDDREIILFSAYRSDARIVLRGDLGDVRLHGTALYALRGPLAADRSHSHELFMLLHERNGFDFFDDLERRRFDERLSASSSRRRALERRLKKQRREHRMLADQLRREISKLRNKVDRLERENSALKVRARAAKVGAAAAAEAQSGQAPG